MEAILLLNLLPGLRDVRTPIIAGYIWLMNISLLFSNFFTDLRRDIKPRLEFLLDTGFLLDTAAKLTVATFFAYILGSLLTITSDSRLFSKISAWGERWLKIQGDPVTRFEYRQFLAKIYEDADNSYKKGNEEQRTSWRLLHTAVERAVQLDDARYLRSRLLVANQGLYGEYDRLAAEAEFRLNIPPPLLVLAAIMGFSLDRWWIAAAGLIVCIALIVAGLMRRTQARDVIQQAVLSRTFVHPAQDALLQLTAQVDKW